jgi:ribosomal protein S8E
MSKRHQSSRRKAYGRRQHEIHERTGRRGDQEPFDTNVGDEETTTFADARPFGFGGAAVRLGFALLD